MTRVLILVMSAMREPWGEMLRVGKETWDADIHAQTRTIYYCGKSPHESTADIFYSASLSEELYDCAGRTMEAFEFSLTIPGWDYMARTHSSCYVHKGNLVDYCETLPTKDLLHGLLTSGENPFLWGGGHYIISRDVIERFVAHKDQWNLGVMEDGSLTNLANDLHIPLSGNGRMCSINEMPDKSYLAMCYGIGQSFKFVDWPDIKKAMPHFYFRVKQDLQRHKDLEIMYKLKQYYT